MRRDSLATYRAKRDFEQTGEPSGKASVAAAQQLRFVTLPSLAPTLLLVSLMTVAGYFQLFAEPYVMTQGGPLQSTTSVLYLMYEDGFQSWNLGSASAVAFVLFFLLFLITRLQVALARRWSAA